MEFPQHAQNKILLLLPILKMFPFVSEIHSCVTVTALYADSMNNVHFNIQAIHLALCIGIETHSIIYLCFF